MNRPASVVDLFGTTPEVPASALDGKVHREHFALLTAGTSVLHANIQLAK